MTKDMVVLSTLVTIIVVTKIEEEGTGVENSAKLNCSIAEVVYMEDNRVEVVVESSDMMVGL